METAMGQLCCPALSLLGLDSLFCLAFQVQNSKFQNLQDFFAEIHNFKICQMFLPEGKTAKFPKKIVFVLGSESKGMRKITDSLCDESLKIKISDSLESLNVSNTAAIMKFYVSNINLKS